MQIYNKYTVLGAKCTVQFMYEGYDGPSTLNAMTGNLVKQFGYDSSTANVPALSPVLVAALLS